MNNAMNPPYGSTGGQPGQGGIPGVPPQPMMRPGFSIPLQQQPPRPYAPPPAGFMPSQGLAPGQPAAPVMPPGGAPRYSAPPYAQMVRPPVFPARPPVGPPPVIMLARPPGTGIRPMPPVLKPLPGMLLNDLGAKGVGQIVAPPEKPHTTVYVGKISSTVEDDFLRATLELCGGIKSWKRAQDPTTGSPKGFGFCEFESAEGVLRALRLLNKYSLDGQELVIY